MTKRKNEYGIKSLIMCPFVTIVHPATQARLQLKAVVEFFPGDYLPEFVEVQNAIRQAMGSQTMQVEEAADKLVEIFNEYKPDGLKVRIDAINNSAFFSVAVTAETGFIGAGSEDAEGAKEKKPPRDSGKKAKRKKEEDEGPEDDEE